jgi:hypothetical protein
MNKRVVYTVQQYYEMISIIQDARAELDRLYDEVAVTADELIRAQKRAGFSRVNSAGYKAGMNRYYALQRTMSECYRLIDAQDQIIDSTRGKMLDYDRTTFDHCIVYNEPVSSERFAKIGVCYSE